MKKYIVYWEWDETDTEEGIRLSKEIDKLRRFPKSLGSSYVEQSPPRGFTLFEATKEQLENWREFYEPVLKITRIQPIIHASEFIEEYERMKERS